MKRWDSMTDAWLQRWFSEQGYLLGSRGLTHLVFWLCLFIGFSLVWQKPEHGLRASFFLEFVLLPSRMLAAYGLIYWLIPRFLQPRRFSALIVSYGLLLSLCACLYRLADHYFYQFYLGQSESSLFAAGEWTRALILVNSTALWLGALKILQLYLQSHPTREPNTVLEVKVDKRRHLLATHSIHYIESMGNYLNVHLANGEKLTTYGTMRAMQEKLPKHFLRVHRSYLANLHHLNAVGSDDLKIGNSVLPRGKDISDDMLFAAQPL